MKPLPIASLALVGMVLCLAATAGAASADEPKTSPPYEQTLRSLTNPDPQKRQSTLERLGGASEEVRRSQAPTVRGSAGPALRPHLTRNQ